MANERKLTDVFAAIEAAAAEGRHQGLAHLARVGRLTDEELRRIEDATRRAEGMGRGAASALDAREELRAVSEMVRRLLGEVRRLRTLVATRTIDAEHAALKAEEAL